MSRFKVFIEYEGTRYSGWQKQQNAKTVQGTINFALSKIFNTEKFDLQGSGRTDGGVHALEQVAHLDVKTMLAPEIIKLKLNDALPNDINILEIEKAAPTFHARHDAHTRSYVYVISKRRTAFNKNFVWWIKDKLNVDAMVKAANAMEGMHDFISFTDDSKDEKSTKALINFADVQCHNDLIYFHISGSHFLWKMVRRLTGVMVEIGRGKKSINDLLYYLNSNTNEPAVFTAPPSGLFLEKIYYKNDKPNKEINISLLNL